jgi:5-methylthioadenosine/S-adenosylhomocysteine deaminase
MALEVTAVTARWTVLPGPEVVENATVVVAGARILDVLPDGSGRDGVTAARRLEFEHGILIPGFVNLHNHAINGPIFRGLVDDDPPEAGADALVHGLLLPLGDHAAAVLDEDETAAVYRLAVIELLRSGTTTVLDMPRPVHSAFFAVAKELGLRAVGAPYIFSTPTRGLDAAGRPVYERIDEAGALEDALAIFDEYDEGPGGLIRVGFGPHATDTCSPELLGRIAREAKDRDTIVSIHVAQSSNEVSAVRGRYGCSPVEYLRDAGALGPNVVAAHCVYAGQSDLDILRDTGTTVANCPLTFARSGVTVPFSRFHDHGVRTGIGTDAYSFDFFAELRSAGFISKLTGGDAGAADAAVLLRAATQTGAAALGRPGYGRIEPGATADLVVVGLGAAHVQPVRDPIRNLVWNATPADVDLVMIDGRVVLADGAVQGCDEAATIRAAASAVGRLWESAERAGVLDARVTRSQV